MPSDPGPLAALASADLQRAVHMPPHQLREAIDMSRIRSTRRRAQEATPASTVERHTTQGTEELFMRENTDDGLGNIAKSVEAILVML